LLRAYNSPEQMRPMPQEQPTDPVQYLCQVDPILGEMISRVGPLGLKPRRQSPYAALIESVIHQQLSGKAAATILRRFRALFPGRAFPKPQDVLLSPDEVLRSAGLSRAKTAAIKDICQKMLDGVVPTLAQIQHLPDEEIVQRLITIRGVGRWTVEMLLIFRLGRFDVLPIHDLGIQKGFARTYGRRKLPSPEALLKHGEKWRPYRTIAAWYLWRSLELPKQLN